MYRKSSTVLAFSDTKTAALFSKYVIPVRLEELLCEVDSDLIFNDLLQGLLPPSLLPDEELSGFYEYASYYLYFLEKASEDIIDLESLENVKQKLSIHRLPMITTCLSKIIKSLNEPILEVVGSPNITIPDNNVEDLCICLKGLTLVDPSKIT